MKKHIVCFGDSNTFGFCMDPTDTVTGDWRFDESERWTRLLEDQLGTDYLVLEEGLPGRTTVFPDPLLEGMAGIDVIVPILRSHAPVDLLVLMLGTNDTKERFGADAACIAGGMERLVRKALTIDCWTNGVPHILIVSPPHIKEQADQEPTRHLMGRGCAEKSRALAPYLRSTAQITGAAFLDAEGIAEFNSIDGMHLTARGHRQLAAKLADIIPAAMQKPF